MVYKLLMTPIGEITLLVQAGHTVRFGGNFSPGKAAQEIKHSFLQKKKNSLTL